MLGSDRQRFSVRFAVFGDVSLVALQQLQRDLRNIIDVTVCAPAQEHPDVNEPVANCVLRIALNAKCREMFVEELAESKSSGVIGPVGIG